MDKIKKYDVTQFENIKNTKASEKIDELHKKRTAFIVVDKKVLYLTDSTMSHYQWATSLGLDIEKFNDLTRGFVQENLIVFYKGNFQYDENVIKDAENYAFEIMQFCKLKNAQIYVGMKVGKIGEKWSPDKYLFSLENSPEKE